MMHADDLKFYQNYMTLFDKYLEDLQTEIFNILLGMKLLGENEFDHETIKRGMLFLNSQFRMFCSMSTLFSELFTELMVLFKDAHKKNFSIRLKHAENFHDAETKMRYLSDALRYSEHAFINWFQVLQKRNKSQVHPENRKLLEHYLETLPVFFGDLRRININVLFGGQLLGVRKLDPETIDHQRQFIDSQIFWFNHMSHTFLDIFAKVIMLLSNAHRIEFPVTQVFPERFKDIECRVQYLVEMIHNCKIQFFKWHEELPGVCISLKE